MHTLLKTLLPDISFCFVVFPSYNSMSLSQFVHLSIISVKPLHFQGYMAIILNSLVLHFNNSPGI